MRLPEHAAVSPTVPERHRHWFAVPLFFLYPEPPILRRLRSRAEAANNLYETGGLYSAPVSAANPLPRLLRRSAGCPLRAGPSIGQATRPTQEFTDDRSCAEAFDARRVRLVNRDRDYLAEPQDP